MKLEFLFDLKQKCDKQFSQWISLLTHTHSLPFFPENKWRSDLYPISDFIDYPSLEANIGLWCCDSFQDSLRQQNPIKPLGCLKGLGWISWITQFLSNVKNMLKQDVSKISANVNERGWNRCEIRQSGLPSRAGGICSSFFSKDFANFPEVLDFSAGDFEIRCFRVRILDKLWNLQPTKDDRRRRVCSVQYTLIQSKKKSSLQYLLIIQLWQLWISWDLGDRNPFTFNIHVRCDSRWLR